MNRSESSLPESPVQSEHHDPVAFFETAYATYQEAERINGAVERNYAVGNHTVRLRFAGPSMVTLITRALEHLAVGGILQPSLTVCIWDDESTHTKMPPPPWVGYWAYTRRGDVRGYNTDRISTAYNYGADVLTVYDRNRNTALYWTRDRRRLPSYETSAPLRTILHWLVTRLGEQFVHGGAVGTREGGVLLAGKGGSGKSTTVLTCLNSDLLYVSDDYCLVRTDPVPYAHSLYCSAKLDPDNLHRVPHVMRALSNEDRLQTEKAVFYLHDHWPQKIATGFPVRALLLLRVAGGTTTRLRPATPMDGLKALALSTMSQLAGAGAQSLQTMNTLVHRIPCLHLELGTDLKQIPDVISRLLLEV